MEATQNEIKELYQRILDGWNKRNAEAMAAPFAENAEMIGFDGSFQVGPEEILSHLTPIFAQNPTPPFISKIKSIRFLNEETAILRGIVGMVPPGQEEIDPKLNAHQILVAQKVDGEWKAQLFQNTPAQYFGRPKLIKQMTEELKEAAD